MNAKKLVGKNSPFLMLDIMILSFLFSINENFGYIRIDLHILMTLHLEHE